MTTPNIVAMVPRTVAYEVPNQADLLTEGEAAVNSANFMGVAIATEADCAAATAEMNACAKRLKELDALRKSITKPMDEAKKAVMALFNPVTEKYTQAVAIYKAGIADYQRRIEAGAMAARLAAEAAAAQQRQALEIAAQQSTDACEREALQEAAASIVATPVVAAPKKIEGATVRKKLKAEVTDLAAYLHYVADHPELHATISVKAAALDRFISATGGAVRVPGVAVHEETSIACRG